MLSSRRRLVSLTWFALFTFLWSVALPVIETHEVADPDVQGFELRASTGGSLRVEKPATSDDAPEHCIFCHWQRAVSGAMVSNAATIASPCIAHSRGRLAGSRPTASVFTAHPSRGPPIHS